MQTSLRFFVLCHDTDNEDPFTQVDIHEVTLRQWETICNDPGNIEYERSTVFQNGVDQVCLTFDPLDTVSSDELETIPY